MRKVSLLALAFSIGCPSEQKEPPKPPEPPAAPKPPASPPPAVEQPPPAAASTGTINGVVTFKGQPPKSEKLDMKKEKKCLEVNKTQEVAPVVVADGKLAEVFVRIAEGLKEEKWPTRSDVITMDQQGCVYKPKMIAIQVDQTFAVLNSDPLLHNVHAFVKRSDFNQAMPLQGSKIEKKFKAQDLEGRIACDVHPWMHAALRVVDHPFFAVTGADGRFVIEKVPAGKYKLEFEHSTLGKQAMDVEVAGGGTAEVSAEFAAK